MNYEEENNREIFNLLHQRNNDELLKMNNSDRVQTMYLLKQYFLELRETLNLDKNIRFGAEIEFEESDRERIELEVYSRYPNYNWIVKDDKSLHKGGEINSPKLKDDKECWIDLSNICNIVSNHAKVSTNTSSHVHICMNILGDNPIYWRNFAKLWMTYENVIFRFLYGEYLSPRQYMEKQAKPISRDLIEDFNRIEDRATMKSAFYIVKVLNASDDKKRSINFKHIDRTRLCDYNRIGNKNTIEFRSPNGTFDPVIWQNNINLLVKLLEYAKSPNFNEEIIDRRLQEIINKEIPSNLFKYSQINIEEALELADLIFNNNLDKIYFLRQYIKDNRVSTKPLVKSKGFTI